MGCWWESGAGGAAVRASLAPALNTPTQCRAGAARSLRVDAQVQVRLCASSPPRLPPSSTFLRGYIPVQTFSSTQASPLPVYHVLASHSSFSARSLHRCTLATRPGLRRRRAPYAAPLALPARSPSIDAPGVEARLSPPISSIHNVLTARAADIPRRRYAPSCITPSDMRDTHS